MSISIDMESTEQHQAISNVVYHAFLNHPHHAPGAKPTEHLIIDELRKCDALTLGLTATQDDKIVGYIAFSPVLIASVQQQWYGLGPVAVLPANQNKGIGALLIKEGLRLLKQSQAAGVVVLGDTHYYTKFGFKHDPRLTLKDVPPEYFMIQPFNTTVPAGEVTYNKAFYITETK